MNLLKLKKNKRTGMSIVETLIYLSIFTMVSIVVINSFIVVVGSMSAIRTNHELLDSGSISMERISREVRNAKNIDLINTPTGGSVLQLNTTDESGNNLVVKFSKDTNALNFYKNGTLVDNLLTGNIVINSLSFIPISSVSSQGVKIQMTLQNNRGKINKVENFYDTVIVRGGY